LLSSHSGVSGMNTQTMTDDQATKIGFALNEALAVTGMQVDWSQTRQTWGYWVQVTPAKREFQPCPDLETAVAACIEIYARRRHAIYRERAFMMD
jgi:hypothetical protein